MRPHHCRLPEGCQEVDQTGYLLSLQNEWFPCRIMHGLSRGLTIEDATKGIPVENELQKSRAGRLGSGGPPGRGSPRRQKAFPCPSSISVALYVCIYRRG